MLFLPLEYEGDSPLNLNKIREEQLEDIVLQNRIWKFPKTYVEKTMGKDIRLTCCVKSGNDPLKQWKVYLLDSMLKDTVHWFHLALGHPGASHLRALISAPCYNPRLTADI